MGRTSEPTRQQGPNPGGIVVVVGGVIIMVGAFLPIATVLGFSGSTIDLMGGMTDLGTPWPVVVVVSGLGMLGAAIAYLADSKQFRTAPVVAALAAVGVGVGLAVGPIRGVIESSGFTQIGLFPSQRVASLGWGFWVVVIGVIIALVGAWVAHVEQAATRSTADRMARHPASAQTRGSTSSAIADRDPVTVPASLIGPVSSGSATGAIPPSEHYLAHGTPVGLIDRMGIVDRSLFEKRGYRVVEAVWSSTTPPKIAVALGPPGVSYRPKWPGRPTVKWTPQPSRTSPEAPAAPTAKAPAQPASPSTGGADEVGSAPWAVSPAAISTARTRDVPFEAIAGVRRTGHTERGAADQEVPGLCRDGPRGGPHLPLLSPRILGAGHLMDPTPCASVPPSPSGSLRSFVAVGSPGR